MRICFVIFIVSFTYYLTKTHFNPYNLYKEIPRGSEETAEIAPLLQQRFYYLSQGSQMYAFVSQDGKTVLKLFKARHDKPYKWTRLFEKMKEKDWKQSRNKWKLKFQNSCRRYRLAFMDLNEETGLIFLHFSQTTVPLLVSLTDRYTHSIDLSKYPFILQKRAVLASEYIRKNPQALHDLKEFFVARTHKGYSDPRQTLSINYGFVEGKPIQIDPGKIERFEGDPQEEIQKIHKNIDRWALRECLKIALK